MSERQSHAAGTKSRSLGYAHHRLEAGVFRGRSIVRWVALLYSAYFFVMPAYRHSYAVWMEFAVFYAAFLILYFLVGELTGRRQTVAFVLFFLIAFLYYPLNPGSLRNICLPFRDALPFLQLVCAPCSSC